SQAIILTPTHELASQVYKEAQLLEETTGRDVGVMMIIGSANSNRQLEKLRSKPKIIIGSTGRILDFIGRRKIPAHLVKTIVLDEGDRLLVDGNFDDLKGVIKATLKDRQLVVLSASIDEVTKQRAKELMKDEVEKIETSSGAFVPENILHTYILSTPRDKFLNLRKLVASDELQKAIVFINNPENIEVTVDKLCHHHTKAVGMYGKASKEDRKTAMEDFREGRAKVLVTSDLGARGLDIKGITHVINMDVPEEPTQYLHRAGRCGRQGLEGVAVTLVTPYERKWVHKYAKTWGISFQQKEMSHGKLLDSQKTKTDLQFKKKSTTQKEDFDAFFTEDEYVWDDTLNKAVKNKYYQQKPVQEPKRTVDKPKSKTKNSKNTNKSEQQSMGFFEKKAKRLEEKQKNRENSTKGKGTKK
ncbi:MAG: DEAD/DEAH box helicase, partial [Bacillota bacterium]